MVRLRSVAVTAAASHAPRPGRHIACILFLTALVVVAGCSSAPARSEPSNLGDRPGTSVVVTTRGTSTATVNTPVPPARTVRQVAVEMAWLNSKTAFYQAALSGNPQSPALLATLVRGGPVYVHSIAYLSALASADVRGPPTWRIGDEHVLSLGRTRARVEGCLFDTGSVLRSTGIPAPPSLGGGAGLTASDATLVLQAGYWLVLTDDVRAVLSSKEPGPCHGF